MSREDVQESLKPIWHLWRRLGYTSEMADNQGQIWPTVHAVCTHCQEHRERVPVAWLEGTAGDIPREVWPGRCNLAPEGRPRQLSTDWVGFETTTPGLGSFGKSIVRAFAHAILLAAFVTVFLTVAEDWPEWLYIPAFAGMGLAGGLFSATDHPSKKRLTPKKG